LIITEAIQIDRESANMLHIINESKDPYFNLALEEYFLNPGSTRKFLNVNRREEYELIS